MEASEYVSTKQILPNTGPGNLQGALCLKHEWKDLDVSPGPGFRKLNRGPVQLLRTHDYGCTTFFFPGLLHLELANEAHEVVWLLHLLAQYRKATIGALKVLITIHASILHSTISFVDPEPWRRTNQSVRTTFTPKVACTLLRTSLGHRTGFRV